MPPEIVPAGTKPIRLEDIDGAVKRWFRNVVASNVADPGRPRGSTAPVHVSFSSAERWVAAADKQGIRDKNGRLILPVIEIIREGVGLSENMSALGANVPTMNVSKLISAKTNDVANADTLRPISSRRMTQAAIYDIYTIPFPVTTNLPFKVKIQAQYEQQMNEIIEKIIHKLEFFDVPSFVMELDGDDRHEGIPMGQGASELLPADNQRFQDRPGLDKPYVVGYIDGDLSSQGNQSEFTDQERIIQVEFSFKVPAVLQLDPEGERPAVQKERTAFSLSIGVEECHPVEFLEELDIIFGPK